MIYDRETLVPILYFFKLVLSLYISINATTKFIKEFKLKILKLFITSD